MTAPAAPTTASMEDIGALARAFAAARAATEALAEDIKALQRKALRSRLRALRTRIAEQAASEEALRAAICARARPLHQTPHRRGGRHQVRAPQAAGERFGG